MSKRQSTLSWGHLNINVRSLDRAVDFYSLLGFEILYPGIPYLALSREEPRPLPLSMSTALGVTPGILGRSVIMQLGEGFPKIDLTEFEVPEFAPPLRNSDVGVVRLCLITEDLRADLAYLKERGVEFVSNPQTAHRGMAEVAVCRDPDGTLIELLQPHLDRPWSLE